MSLNAQNKVARATSSNRRNCLLFVGTLLHRIERCEHFDEMEAARVVKDIATALAFLHDNGIAHRDLKPANILCETEDKVCVFVIIFLVFLSFKRSHGFVLLLLLDILLNH